METELNKLEDSEHFFCARKNEELLWRSLWRSGKRSLVGSVRVSW